MRLYEVDSGEPMFYRVEGSEAVCRSVYPANASSKYRIRIWSLSKSTLSLYNKAVFDENIRIHIVSIKYMGLQKSFLWWDQIIFRRTHVCVYGAKDLFAQVKLKANSRDFTYLLSSIKHHANILPYF